MLSERELAEFKRGPLQMLVLWILKKDDMYGYQIAQYMNQHSEGLFRVTEGALYTVLYRLLKDGHISKQKEEGVNRPRVFYHLEPSGEELLAEQLAAYESIEKGIRNILKDQSGHRGVMHDG